MIEKTMYASYSCPLLCCRINSQNEAAKKGLVCLEKQMKVWLMLVYSLYRHFLKFPSLQQYASTDW